MNIGKVIGVGVDEIGAVGFFIGVLDLEIWGTGRNCISFVVEQVELWSDKGTRG